MIGKAGTPERKNRHIIVIELAKALLKKDLTLGTFQEIP
jgi:hypothetical protein